MLTRGIWIALALVAAAQAFTVTTQKLLRPATRLAAADAWTGDLGANNEASGGGTGALEQIEFKIHPDGRVEETVRGVKGSNCHEVTEKINEKLGEVVASSPTEEMYEQEVTVTETLYNTDSSDDWDGSSSW